jgi:pantoate--beta-alanine ligase
MNSAFSNAIQSHTGKMVIIKEVQEIAGVIQQFRATGKAVGFVPTMGALHAGHLALVKKAATENDRVVVSIFVNPTQFNNQDDLKNYPRTPEADYAMLRESKVDVVFSPEVADIYTDATVAKSGIELGEIAKIMEGSHRPGHFAGVVQIVSRLFEIIEPKRAYFGEKDFQQLAIVRYLVKKSGYPVEIIGCPTVREQSGLAMSSRNVRLSKKGLEDASVIYKTLSYIRDNRKKSTPAELKIQAVKMIESVAGLKVEYVEIADAETLEELHQWDEKRHARCFTAVYCEGVRLIDNVSLD